MSFPSRRLVFAGLVGCVLLLALPVAAERTQSDFVLIRAEDVVTEDLYAAGNRVEIDGRVEGDLVAVAFEEVRVDGEVTGSVMALASRVVIAGHVGGSVRAAAVRIEGGGEVGGDLVTTAGTLSWTGTVGRDALVWAWNAAAEGSIGRNLEGVQRRLLLGGTVTGDVAVAVDRLDIAADLTVGGDLAYRSDREANVAGATVTGTVVRQEPTELNVRVRALRLMSYVVALIGLAAVGLAGWIAFPARMEAARSALQGSPGRAALAGLEVMVVPFGAVAGAGVLLALAPPAAALPLLAVIGPILLAVFGLFMLGLVVSPLPVLGAVGQRLRRRWSGPAAFLVGLGLLALVLLVPILRWLVVLVVVILGMGGWVRSGRGEPGVVDAHPWVGGQTGELEPGVTSPG